MGLTSSGVFPQIDRGRTIPHGIQIMWIAGIGVQLRPPERGQLSPFELGDEKDLAARADRLEIGGLVDGTIDRDGGFFDEMLAQTGVEFVHRFDDAAQVFGLDRKFAHAASVPPAEAGGEDDARSHRSSLSSNRHGRAPSRGPSADGLVPWASTGQPERSRRFAWMPRTNPGMTG